MTRYQHLATLLSERIKQGLYGCGERLPSVRQLSKEHGVSISTVQQAYHVLEDRQLVVPHPRSGYFVAIPKAQPPVPQLTRPVQRPVEVTQWDNILTLISSRHESDVTPLGSGMPSLTQSTLKPLLRDMNKLIARQGLSMMAYDSVTGLPALREQIARLMLDSQCHISADDIVITTGCHEALSIAIRSVCQPGDIIAVESPSFHGTMQTLRGFGIKVIEIPTDSLTGISVEALELALEQWPIKAVILIANCHNPLGFIMPEARKRALLNLAQRFDIAVIEDDVYGELAYEYPRPVTIKSMDMDGRVLLCSSFSKTVAPGMRVGWIVPGRYYDRAVHMKYIGTGSSANITQQLIANFIAQGHYHRHTRRVRQYYQRNLAAFADLVRHYFPSNICLSRPQGGFLMWIELPVNIDTVRLNQFLLDKKINIAVGSLFSASGKYRNCLRLNYACEFNDAMKLVLKTLGEAVTYAIEQCDSC